MPKLITQDALMNEHDASNSNSTPIDKCNSKTYLAYPANLNAQSLYHEIFASYDNLASYAQAGGNGNTSSAWLDPNSQPANPVLDPDLRLDPSLCGKAEKY